MQTFLTPIGIVVCLAMFTAAPMRYSVQAAELCGLWSEGKQQGPESP